MFGWTQPWLANIGYKESLKRTSTAAGTGNTDVGRKIHYLTNLSLKIEFNWISDELWIQKPFLIHHRFHPSNAAILKSTLIIPKGNYNSLLKFHIILNINLNYWLISWKCIASQNLLTFVLRVVQLKFILELGTHWKPYTGHLALCHLCSSQLILQKLFKQRTHVKCFKR